MNISATMISTALSCPRRYYLRYVAGEPDIPNSSAMWGSVVHAVGEQLIRDPSLPAREVYDDAFRRAVEELPIPFLSFTPLADLYRAGIPILRHFLTYAGTQRVQEESITVPFDDVTITGRIDLITVDGVIVDFKTSKYIPKDVTHDPQTVLYQYLYLRTYGTPARGMVFHYLRTNTIIHAPIYDQDTLETMYLRPWIERIIRIQSLPPVCSSCPPFCARQQEYLHYDKSY